MKKNILICVCCKDNAPIELTQCLTEMAVNTNVAYGFTYYKGAAIEIARNAAVREMLNGTYSHLLFIDDDMQVPPDLVSKLLSLNADIAAAPYVKKSYGEPKLNVWDNLRVENGRMRLDDIKLIKGRRFYDVGGVGMGCTMIRRNVFEDVIKTFNTCFFPQYFAGEDMTFCYLANQCGYRVKVDASINVYHMGLYNYGLKDYARVYGLEVSDVDVLKEAGDRTKHNKRVKLSEGENDTQKT